MKYVILILVSLFAESTHSQDLVSVANTFLNDQNYVEAKSAIDEAFQKNDIAQNPRAWYIKARVYHEILKADDPSLNQFKKDRKAFIATIVEAYNKTLELADRSNNYRLLANNQIETMWAEGINEAVTLFKKQKFNEVIDVLEMAKLAKPRDTTAYAYSGLSALYAQKYTLAVENYNALKNIAGPSKSIYDGLIIAKRSLKVSTNDLLDVIEDARFEFPDHIPYIIEHTRTLIRLNRLDAAESVLATALKRNPNNAQLVLRQADLFDILFKSTYVNGEPERSERYFEGASTNYERFLQSFPNDFTANYNYAVMMNEQANRIYVRINLMSDEEFALSGKELEEIGHDWTRKALPYMEKAWELRKGDEKVAEALRVFYGRLKMDEKLAALDGN